MPWLRKNYPNLPKGIFYTAIGFESKWYESHVWLMLMKLIINNKNSNDGVVSTDNVLFPSYFNFQWELYLPIKLPESQWCPSQCYGTICYNYFL